MTELPGYYPLATEIDVGVEGGGVRQSLAVELTPSWALSVQADSGRRLTVELPAQFGDVQGVAGGRAKREARSPRAWPAARDGRGCD